MLCLSLAHFATAATFNVQTSGVAGDGKTVDTPAIQKAIDNCSRQGGGTLEFPPGNYLTGSVILKNNVILHLDANATLLGNPDIEDYTLIDEFKDGTGQSRGYALVGAMDAKNVGIEGDGIVDGQGKDVLQRSKAAGKDRKPFLVRWVRCSGVVVHGVELRNSAAWTMHVSQSRDVDIRNVKINGHVASNNDGIDIDSSKSVQVHSCNIDTGDDAICLKTTGPQACRHITIAGCTLKSNCGAIKLGTESDGDFDDINISNCHILDARLGGIKLLSVDGGNLHGIRISDITMDKGHVAIFMRLGARLKTFRPGDAKPQIGSLRDVEIKNIKAKVMDPGILISGIPDHDVEAVTLENIELHLPGNGTREDAATTLSEKIGNYPEITMFGKNIPASALFARHVNDLKIHNLVVTTDAPDGRPAVVCEQVQAIAFTDWKLPASMDAEWLIRLTSCHNAILKNIRFTGTLATFLRVDGADSSGIQVMDEVKDLSKPISFGDNVSREAVLEK